MQKVAIASLVAALAMALFTVSTMRAPDRVAENAPVGDFSSARAMKQLAVISQKPHPVGSPENVRVKDYILSELKRLGLQPVTQLTTSANHLHGARWRKSARLENILVRIPGTRPGKGILLAAHYDSAEHSRGASDDGSGVVTLLETARALMNSPRLKNDVLMVFSDGEEPGLLGAIALADRHPWIKDAGLVLNFEARGSHGPTAMYEMSAKNGFLIKEFGKAAEHPISNSFVSALSKVLPNDTDFTIYKQAGIPGFSFAYADGLENYHTYNDSMDSVDEKSVQHSGSYALALTRHFGDLDLNYSSGADRIYFDVFGVYFLSYLEIWAKLFGALFILLFALLFRNARRADQVSFKGTAGNFLFLIFSILSSVAAVLILRRLAELIPDRGHSSLSWAATPGYLLTTFAFFAAVYETRKRRGELDGIFAVLALWVILSTITGFLMPGGSYVFQIPLLLMLLAVSTRKYLWLCLAAIPGVLLPTTVIYTAVVAMGPGAPAVPCALAALLFALLIPSLDVLDKRRMRLACAGFLGLGILGVLASAYGPKGGSGKPTSEYMIYALDVDQKQAFWISSVRKPRPGGKLLGTFSSLRTFPQFFTSDSVKRYVVAPVVKDIIPPEIILVDDRSDQSGRTRHLKLLVQSPRKARCFFMWQAGGEKILGEKIEGFIPREMFRFSPDTDYKLIKGMLDGLPVTNWRWEHCAAEGHPVRIELETEIGRPLKLRIADYADGLPESLKLEPRPAELIPYELGDRFIVSKKFEF